jgi:hypothetical protein
VPPVIGRLLCRQTAVSADCCVGRLLCRQTAVSADCCVGRLLYRQTAVSADCCVGRLLCRQTVYKPHCSTAGQIRNMLYLCAVCDDVALIMGIGNCLSVCLSGLEYKTFINLNNFDTNVLLVVCSDCAVSGEWCVLTVLSVGSGVF